MNEHPTEDFAAGRSWRDEERAPVDRVEEPGRRLPTWLRVVTAVAAAAFLGGVALSLLLPRHHGPEAASSGPPTPPDPHLHVQRVPPETAPMSPTAGVTARGHIAGRFSPGDVLVFDVTLRSSRFFSLHPCPTYTITFGRHASTRRLSCAHVPYLASLVHPDGQVTDFRPVLPAGTQVVFRMRVAVPDEPGRQHVRWTLNASRPRPRLSGVVDVTASGSG